MLEGGQICVVIVILLTLPLRLTRAVPESDSSTHNGHWTDSCSPDSWWWWGRGEGHTKMLLFPIYCVLESQGWPEFLWKTLGRWEIARDEAAASGWLNDVVGSCVYHGTRKWMFVQHMSLLPGLCYQHVGSWRHSFPCSYISLPLPEQHNSSCLGWINNSRNLSLDPHLHCFMVHRGLYNCWCVFCVSSFMFLSDEQSFVFFRQLMWRSY